MSVKRWRRRVTDPLVGLGMRIALLGIGLLSYRALGQLACILGRLLRVLGRSQQRLMLANLHAAFPDWPAGRHADVARAATRNMVLTGLEFLWFTRHPQRLCAHVDMDQVEGAEILAVGRSSRGAMMITPHLGNWEIMGQVVAAHGLELHAVAHPIRNHWIERLVTRARRYHGMIVIPSDGAARGILGALRRGRPVGILMDQNTRPREGGVFVDFFGLPVTTTRAPAAMARKLGAAVIVAACVREDGHLRTCFERLPRDSREYDDDLAMTQDMIAANERLIRRYPEQYAWAYRRWRYIPADASPELARRFPEYARSVEARDLPPRERNIVQETLSKSDR